MSLTFNRIRERVSFELGKEIEKDGFRLVTSVGQKKKFFYQEYFFLPRVLFFTKSTYSNRSEEKEHR